MSAKKSHKFYGHGIPRVKAEDLGGKLIVVEGADGSGRSTQIAGQPQLVLRRIEIDQVQQAPKRPVTALNVANRINSH